MQEPKMYGFFSALAVHKGHGSNYYATPDGQVVEVTHVGLTPDAPEYCWADKQPRGIVTCWVREGYPNTANKRISNGR